MIEVYELDWCADIIPGKSIAGFSILINSYEEVKDALGKLDRKNFRFEGDCTYLEVFDNKIQYDKSVDILIRFFFNVDGLLDESIVYKTNTGNEYKGKIYGKYGLRDKISAVSEFGVIERSNSGEEFFLIQCNNSCGLSIANGLDSSLEDDPEQDIAIIKVHGLR